MTNEYISPYTDEMLTRDVLVRELKGAVYMARLRLAQLEKDNADPQAIADAEQRLEQTIARAREEGVE